MSGGGIATYDALIEALRDRKAVVGIADVALDDLIGWSRGWTGKVLSDARTKRLGMQSLFELMAGLGVTLQLVEDVEATKRIRRHHRFKARIDSNVRARVLRISPRTRSRMMAEIGKIGGAARNASVPPSKQTMIASLGGRARAAHLTQKRRQQIAIKAAVARWQKKSASPAAPAPRSKAEPGGSSAPRPDRCPQI
jgi:hypothetical protein